MELSQLYEILKAGGIGLGVILLGLIKIPKLELNIWGCIANGLGKALNRELTKEIKEVKEEVKDIKEKVDTHITEDDKRDAKNCRQRILRFNDEILDSKKHTKESYDCTLDDIDTYEKYCTDHPDFPNSQCISAVANIKEAYQDCMRNKKFE